MAQVDLFATRVLCLEGGFVNDPTDHGGATNKGVTLDCWRQVGYDKDGDGDIDIEDIRLLSDADAIKVFKKHYWDRWQADKIKSQSLAEILVDWVWCSGKWGIVIPQRLLKVQEDGFVGLQTLSMLNSVNPRGFHEAVFRARQTFIEDLVRNHPEQKKFIKGWMNRLSTFKFIS